ncbi:unnamed protein product, partial [Closterium sp. Naga37s-1]
MNPTPLPRWAVRRLLANAAAVTIVLLSAIVTLIPSANAAASCSAFRATHPLPPPHPKFSPLRKPPQHHLAAPAVQTGALAHRALMRRLPVAPAAGAASSNAVGRTAAPVLQPSHLRVLVQLQEAWGGAWAGNSNATTACSAWAGVTCSPDGLVLALDSKAFTMDPPPTGAIPAAITDLTTLQYLDLTYGINLEGPMPSLASLTRLTHLALGADGCLLTGTVDQLSWLSSLSALHLLRLSGLSEFTGELTSFALLSHLHHLQHLSLIGLSNVTGEIPREIRYLTALTTLDLIFLRAVDFPDWVTQMSKLQSLRVINDEPRRQGVLPEGLSELTALTQLSLLGNNLEGALPKGFSTLANLAVLDLSLNHLQGTIPEAYSALSALAELDLSSNYLSGLVPRIFNSNIQSIMLSYNSFSGPIPPHLALPSLVLLELFSNRFTGGVPHTFTRLTAIASLIVSNNSLSSGLDVVAQMTWLTDIDLHTNIFSGVLPVSFAAIKGLTSISIQNNHFTGSFPEPLLSNTGLEVLNLSNNSFTGFIPNRLTELVSLGDINLSDNMFRGVIPPGLFHLPLLNSLQVANNFLSGGLPTSLKASNSLKTLNLAGNGFTGHLPDFSLWHVNLERLALNHNNFTGSIPDSISTLTSLNGIILNNNQLNGSIPSAIFSMTNLASLYLANNRLSGSLPAAISRLEKLEQLWLDNNNIEGTLPSAICSLPELWRIMMSNNYLYGPLPECIFDKCVNQIDVSGNSLYGRINRNFKSMVADGDALINLAHNFFFGDAVVLAAGCQVCPAEIAQPNNLVLGDTGDGAVGKCASSFTAVRDYSVAGAGKEARVSVAGNCLTLSPDAECSANATQRSTAACQAFCSITDNGPCDGHGECVPPAPASPSNFTCVCRPGFSALDSGNGSTCAVFNSSTTTVSSLSTGAIVGIAVGCFAGFVLLAAVLSCLLWPRGQRKWQGLEVCEQYTLHQMVKATDNWAKENEVGRGGFGIVYKGHSPQGQTWAIKRSTVMTNNFEREVRAMATLNHVNLVRLLGFCVDQNVETGNQEQILVYEFVANRDLQYHIFKTKNPLSLRQRLRLAQGAAEGLAYLHGFETPIIHRDIKPANILVTADMHAKVADFGLLKRLTHCEGDATRVAGTPGYVDPDYNRTRVVTTKSDVFSFGIVLLELLTGSTPIRYESHIRDW